VSRVQKEYSFMAFAHFSSRHRFFVMGALLTLLAVGSLAALHLKASQLPPAPKPGLAADKGISPEALRLNTLGVAYMNQQKAAEAQKYFEQALAADPQFAAAKMN